MNEKLKQEALKRLNYLVKEKQLAPKVEKDLEKHNLKYWSDIVGILFWANEDGGMPEDVINKIEDLEKHGAFVYHITHEFSKFGELYDLWCVTDEDCGDEEMFEYFKEGLTFAYVINKSIPEFSEFGTIEYKVINGGCARTA